MFTRFESLAFASNSSYSFLYVRFFCFAFGKQSAVQSRTRENTSKAIIGRDLSLVRGKKIQLLFARPCQISIANNFFSRAFRRMIRIENENDRNQRGDLPLKKKLLSSRLD